MLSFVRQLNYVIVLCDDIDPMKAFYRDLFEFPIYSESETGLTFDAGSIFLGLRQRTRHFDGRGTGSQSPGMQIAFLVSPAEVDQCRERSLSAVAGQEAI